MGMKALFEQGGDVRKMLSDPQIGRNQPTELQEYAEVAVYCRGS
jgi:hypothetical protein